MMRCAFREDPEVVRALPRRGTAPGREDPPDPVGELRLEGRPRGLVLGLHQQVQRGLPRQALLRGAAVRRSARAAGHRPRQGAVRRRARQRPALLGLAGQPGRLSGVPQAGRQGDGARAADGRPPHARLERLDHAASTSRRCPTAIRKDTGRLDYDEIRDLAKKEKPRAPLGRRHRLLAPLGLRDHGARSRARWARSSAPTSRTSPGSSRAACTPRPCRTPTSSRRRRTRRCAARAAA